MVYYGFLIKFKIMKSILNKDDYQNIVNRINKLTPETKPKWGKMNSAQVLAHMSEVQEVQNGKPLEGTPWFVKVFFKGMIKKMVFSQTPYKPNTQTHPQYIVSSPQEFEEQKERFLKALEFMHKENPPLNHPLFGKVNDEDKGWSCYKHHDHHLKQFEL